MRAILISQRNKKKISLSTNYLTEAKLNNIIEDYGDRFDIEPVYFASQLDEAAVFPEVTNMRARWVVIPKKYLNERYDYDSEKIKTDFVELVEKK